MYQFKQVNVKGSPVKTTNSFLKAISMFVLMFSLIQDASCAGDDIDGENPQTPQVARGRHVTKP